MVESLYLGGLVALQRRHAHGFGGLLGSGLAAPSVGRRPATGDTRWRRGDGDVDPSLKCAALVLLQEGGRRGRVGSGVGGAW